MEEGNVNGEQQDGEQQEETLPQALQELPGLGQYFLNRLNPLSHLATPLPAIGWSGQNSTELRSYLQFLRTAAAYINWGISKGLPLPKQFVVHPKPIRFNCAKTRTTWAARRWHVWGYPGLAEMEDSWDTVVQAADSYDPEKVNYFLFFADWSKMWWQTTLHRILHPPKRFDAVLGGEENLEVSGATHLIDEHQQNHANGTVEPHAFLLRIEDHEVTYFDPFYDEKWNPVIAEEGGSLRRITDVYWSQIAQQFIKTLRSRGHGIYNIGNVGGGGEWGNFPGVNTLERCLCYIRDEMWAWIRGEPLQPHEQVYPDVGEWRKINL